MPKEPSSTTPSPEAAAPAAKTKKKKTLPTNCAQSNKRIRRKDWYYRNGRYFANKPSFKQYAAQEAEKKKKEAAAAAAPAAGNSPVPGTP